MPGEGFHHSASNIWPVVECGGRPRLGLAWMGGKEEIQANDAEDGEVKEKGAFVRGGGGGGGMVGQRWMMTADYTVTEAMMHPRG